MATIESDVRRTARNLVEFARNGGELEVIEHFAAPIPSTTIGDLIGLDRHLHMRCHALSEISIAGAPEQAAVANDEIYAMFEPVLAARRSEPRDDLISALLTAEVDGRPLTHEELLGYLLHLVVAGNDTTANLIGTGVVIPAGAVVELYWGAANRDERNFVDPDSFVLGRTDAGHVGFGHGVHFCLGSHLARLEARVAFEELLAVAPSYRLIPDQPLEIKSGWSIRGYRRAVIELR